MSQCEKLDAALIDAVIFDLDGVVTDTASLHAEAWKEMFDGFLNELSRRTGRKMKPFDIQRDYLRYVDGRPRYDGVRTFLQSRDIDLPFGSPEDPPEQETVCGLGNRKNQLYRRALGQKEVKVYHSAVALIHSLRAAGIKTGLATSSKNGRDILKVTRLTDLFDAIVDGREMQQLNLAGKPEPDIFLHAARQIGVAPERAVVVEDAVSGVEAGHRGGFGCVIGVDRHEQGKQMLAGGADVVVTDLSAVTVIPGKGAVEAPALEPVLPSALDHLEDIRKRLSGRKPIVFLDYDGTLTPIVQRPEDAVLPPAMREALKQLAQHCTVAVVSGRDLQDVRAKVGLAQLYYAGSHGFDLAEPDGRESTHQEGERFLPALDEAEQMLRQDLEGIAGTRVERKRFAVAIHYREVAETDVPAVDAAVGRVHERVQGLRRSRGKKVFELQPELDWHKGRAVRWVMSEALKLNREQVLPFYVGDDVTDEDAFRELREDGVCIRVDEGAPQPTEAAYRLENTDEVCRFLRRLTQVIEGRITRQEWRLCYEGFDPRNEGLREALCTLGNGYFFTRGAWPQAQADQVHYPGTYLAGGYNRLETEIAGRIIENEDLVNLPNWLCLTFRLDDGNWFDASSVSLLSYRQELHIQEGVLHRSFRFRDRSNRVTRVKERRLVHMEHAHLAALELTVTPENWSGSIEFRTAIDGRVVNDGVARYRKLNKRHLQHQDAAEWDREIIVLKTQTNQSDVQTAMAARTRFFQSGEIVAPARKTMLQPGYASQLCPLKAKAGQSIRVEKVVALFTSRDPAIAECGLAACKSVQRAEAFAALLASQRRTWEHLWRRFGLELDHNDVNGENHISMVVHLYLFHLLQTLSINIINMGLDVGVPSRGWHGEAYRGHIFWDELFIFPTINLRLPEITKNLLMYRYRRLNAARRAARAEGFQGAMFPWQSGSNGREESQQLHLNPRSGRWLPDNSHLQRHVNIAIAYNLYQYYQVTHDRQFMSFYGAEMLLEIARFLASIARYNAELGRFEILHVMGPDEYHDAYPGAPAAGLNNNAYTNIMAVWVLERAQTVLRELPEDVRAELTEKLDLQAEELDRWEQICRKMRVVFHADGIISQFEGYADLQEFDWQGYRTKYGDIQRLDRILEAEGDTPNHYKASKQADVLMLFYLLSSEELAEIFEKLGYPFAYETIPKNINYYIARTSHGSTLSSVVHAWVMARSDRAGSWELFGRALKSDVADIQGGTTPEGIHLGAMTGTIDLLQRGYTGIVTRGDVLWFNPCLPEQLERLRMRIRYQHHFLEIDVTHHRLEVTALQTTHHAIQIGIYDQVYKLSAGKSLTVELENCRG